MSDVYGFATPDLHAAHLSVLTVDDARAELEAVLASAMPHVRTNLAEFARALDWNARLVTALRQRGVKLWGTGDTRV